MGLTPGQLAGRVVKYNLVVPHERARFHNPNAASTKAGRTRFTNRITDRGAALKPGQYSRKLGSWVTKGKWKGMPIFSLTLEERATCPKDCALWVQCYGNNLNWAKRMRHGDGLEEKLWRELTVLQRRYPRGFVVRLHVLGDFWSVGYVELWREALAAFPALRVWGYTAWKPCTRIGRAVAALRDQQWERFAIRTSGASEGLRTRVVKDPSEAESGEIICPVEYAKGKKAKSCATCALCWSTTKPIVFLEH